jgi:hypothetical protein
MGTKVVKASLLSYIHYVTDDSARPLEIWEGYEIPPNAIHYVGSNSFDEVMKKLLFVYLIGDACKWYDSSSAHR